MHDPLPGRNEPLSICPRMPRTLIVGALSIPGYGFGTPSNLVQSSVVNEDQKATVCDLRWRPSHEYDRCGGFVLAPGSLEIGRRKRGLVPGVAIPAKGAGRSPRAVVERALGAQVPRK